ncbi:unnamed protein product [Rotaria socialis]|uniref:Uncharacterized protein n=1 Tax=Rotaria socialis TaxID=392032 RepID=A0A820DHZ6_9BILA|nr:unnamed protein product [Rotaria socialis]CAF3384873.1 unnamed protein product [Rotaria socialis]CAF3409214.1 unnamed protein product [Rotaria socialis]CAF3476199.1 unnamed protein product [Rotaria socialis]CAF3592406.1 unnamed protein product [Rotaria socialis]
MANGCCSNRLCTDRETQLHLARLREELLTNFNSLLLDRIRFLEQTITRLSSPSSSSSSNVQIAAAATAAPPPTPVTPTSKNFIAAPVPIDRLSTPSPLRRSSSTTTYFLLSPSNQNSSGNGGGARSCPSSVDLSSSSDRSGKFFSSKKRSQSRIRQSSESNANYLSIPMNAPWSTFTHDLVSNTHAGNEKGRLESRRFACDVDDNEVRAFKAMIYMEQARKQHARPLTRLRQALGISTNSTAANYTLNSSKKNSNP